MIRHLLCPVDCSDCSRQALQVALTLATWRGAHVSVLDVGPAVMIYPALVARVTPSIVATPTRAERALRVARFLQPYVDPLRPIDVILEEGDPAAAIAAAVRPHAIDLIVMGTHGRSGLAHLTFGSVTEQVMRAAVCPVLVVPPGVRLLPGFHGFTRILCSAATVDRAHGPLLADVDRGHIIRVPPTASSDDILQATSDAGPDLIVWDRESPAIATLVRRATVPVLTVTASGAARARHQPTEECVR